MQSEPVINNIISYLQDVRKVYVALFYLRAQPLKLPIFISNIVVKYSQKFKSNYDSVARLQEPWWHDTESCVKVREK